MPLPPEVDEALDTLYYYIRNKEYTQGDADSVGEWKELDHWISELHEKTAEYASESTLHNNIEEETAGSALAPVDDEHAEYCFDNQPSSQVENDQTTLKERMRSPEGHIESLIADALDNEAKRVQKIALQKEKILALMQDMHEASLRHDEERHRRTLQHDRERLLLYREHASFIFESTKSPRAHKKRAISDILPSSSGHFQHAPGKPANNKKPRILTPEDILNRRDSKRGDEKETIGRHLAVHAKDSPVKRSSPYETIFKDKKFKRP